MSGVALQSAHADESALKWKGFTPFQIVSLLEMLDKYASGFFILGTRLQVVINVSNNIFRFDTRREPYQMPDDKIEIIKDDLTACKGWCERVGLEHTGKLVKRILDSPATEFRSGKLEHTLGELKRRMEDELESVYFLHVPSKQAKMYGATDFLEQSVYDKFENAREDILEASKCYALGLHTACVFHLMRVVEIGAKQMVAEMKAAKFITEHITVRGVKKEVRKPLELCDWDRIIKGLNSALNVLEKGKSTSLHKKTRHSHYSGLTKQFEWFKNAWRNNISHGHDVAKKRKLYDPGETQDILDHTKQFMKRLVEGYK